MSRSISSGSRAFIVGVIGKSMWWAIRERKPGLLQKTCPCVPYPARITTRSSRCDSHHLQQDFDRFLAVVALVVRPVQVIGLVDDSTPPSPSLVSLSSSARCGRYIADQFVAGHRHHLPAPHETELVQNAAIPQRHPLLR